MDISEIKQHLELALSPVKKPPTIEEALEQVSTHGVLRGPVDWVFPAWMLYVEYAVQKIAEMLQLSEEERRTLLNFRDTVKRLLLEAQRQAKEKLTSIYKAVVDGTYRIEGNELYAPDGTWMYVGRTVMHIPIHGISAKTYFPDVLKLPQEKLELFQLGWRASDESELDGRPFMSTTQPWQVFAWAAARCGALRILITLANLTRKGVSVSVYLRANSWGQRWSKDEAVDLVISHFGHGEWMPLLAMWLGDGKVKWRGMLSGRYELVIAAKEPWRLGLGVGTHEALVATGKEAFIKLREAASAYGVLLDLLRAHKWVNIKLATDDNFKAAAKQNKNSITVEGVVMYLRLVSGRGGSLLAEHYTRDVGKALEVAEKLKAAGLRPNVVRSGPNYVVYIATADLLRLAERDETVRKAIALYLAEKAKDGTPRQREIAEKILKRHPLFQTQPLEVGILNWL
ncbi:MAG: hypothetical protein ACO2PM_01995 [Pyrobaculum sp.]|jgi:hypothetical protein